MNKPLLTTVIALVILFEFMCSKNVKENTASAIKREYCYRFLCSNLL